MTSIRTARAAEGQFVQLSNSAGQDPRLSLEARGLIYFLLSLPSDKRFTAEWIELQVPNGREAVRAALRELASLGYFQRTCIAAGKGKWVWEQVISDAPTLSGNAQTCGNTASSQVATDDGKPSDVATCENAASSQFATDDGFPSAGNPSDKYLIREELNTETRGPEIESPASPKTQPEQKPKGRGRTSHGTTAYKTDARDVSNDHRLTGSSARASVDASFTDPVQRQMASEFVKALREYKPADVIKAAGLWFTENSYVLNRGIDNPRAYARKCAHSVQETLDGWKVREESRRHGRENDARNARLDAEHEKQRTAEAAAKEAAGLVPIDLFSLDDPTGVPPWLPREQAVQKTNDFGQLVWLPKL